MEQGLVTLFNSEFNSKWHPNRSIIGFGSRTLTRASPASRSRAGLVPPEIALSPLTDSGILGDFQTRFDRVNLVGATSPDTLVILRDRGRVDRSQRTRSDNNGRFEFANVPLQVGNNRLVLEAVADGRSLFRQQVRRVQSEDDFHPVLQWNGVALRAALAAGEAPPLAARKLAIVHAAMYDAVAATDPALPSYRFRQALPGGTSQNLVAIAAAHRTLSQLYPDQRLTLEQEWDRSLSSLDRLERPSPTLRAAAIDWGERVANQFLTARQNDGSEATVNYPVNPSSGKWRPNPPNFRPAALPQWQTVTPFILTRPDQFRPPAPPALTSRKYANELNQVKRLGASASRDRTLEQTEIAKFWAVSSPLHWNQITAQLLASHQPLPRESSLSRARGSTAEMVRTFALLNVALADAAIAAWDAKYTYATWRPITAIRFDGDGNRQTQPQRNWDSLLATPNHPDYVSAHSTFSGAASVVLADLFGDRLAFVTGSLGLPGRRSYHRFSQAANEVGISRIYGGIHTQSANQEGLRLGRRLGRYVMATGLNAPNP